LILISVPFIVLVVLVHQGTNAAELFEAGKEYVYEYQGLFTTGTEVPVAHASSYRLTGSLIIQGTSSNTFQLKVCDYAVCFYNQQNQYGF